MRAIKQKILDTLLSKTVWGATLIAISLWLYLSLSETGTLEQNVPINVILPEDRALENEIASELKIRFAGEGWDLFYFHFFDKNLECRIDLTGEILNDTNVTISNTRILSSITSSNKIKPRAVLGNELNLTIGRIADKQVPLVSDISIITQPGYKVADNITLDPDSVTVRGNVNLLQTISVWKTDDVVFDNVADQIDTEVPVSDTLKNTVIISPETVRLTAKVRKIVDILIEDVPVKIRGKVDKRIRIYPEHIDVAIAGSLKNIAGITRDSVEVILHRSDIINSRNSLVVPEIVLPKNCDLISISPPYIEIVKEHNRPEEFSVAPSGR